MKQINPFYHWEFMAGDAAYHIAAGEDPVFRVSQEVEKVAILNKKNTAGCGSQTFFSLVFPFITPLPSWSSFPPSSVFFWSQTSDRRKTNVKAGEGKGKKWSKQIGERI